MTPARPSRRRSERAFSQRLAEFFEKGMQAFADQQSKPAQPTMLNRLIRVSPGRSGYLVTQVHRIGPILRRKRGPALASEESPQRSARCHFANQEEARSENVDIGFVIGGLAAGGTEIGFLPVLPQHRGIGCTISP